MKIVILPGLDGTGSLSSLIQAELEDRHFVVPVAYPHQLYRYEDIVNWLRPRLPVDDFVLVAESFSGPIAVLLGAGEAPGLKGIVFVATFAQRPSKLPARLSCLLELVPLHGGLVARLAQPFLMGKWSTHAFTHQFRQSMRDVPSSTLSKRLAEVLAVDVRDALARIEISSIYLKATSDRLVPAKMALDFASGTTEVKDIEGPHFLLQAKAVEVAIHITEFANAVDH